MKKLFALLLSLVLALSLAACGEKDNGGNGGGNNSTPSNKASQGGNDTNKSGVWTDADAQTVTEETQAGIYVITMWDGKNTTEIVNHPASSKHKISIITGYTGEIYVPFKIVYTNTYTKELSVEALGAYLHESISDGDAILYAAFEGDSEYAREAGNPSDHFGLSDTKVQPNETVTIYGYIEISQGVEDVLFHFGRFIRIYFEGTSNRAIISST
jgi:hypothetical protein